MAGQTPTVQQLCDAAQAGDLAQIEEILAQNALLARQPITQNGQLAIQFAAREGYAEIVAALLAAGADPRRGVYPNRRATSALAYARARGYSKIVALIEDFLARQPAADPTLADHPSHPLTVAAEKGVAEMVALLLDHGADPDAPEDLDLGDEGIYNNAGIPLWRAAKGNHYEVCQRLLAAGADPNAYVFASGPAAERAME